MTYLSGGLIQATDYNGFLSTVNGVWGTGSGDAGYGQTPLSTVSTGGTVTATQWSNLLSTVSSMASHQGTSISAISPSPVTGGTITYFNQLSTNISAVTGSADNNAAAVGTQYTAWTGTSGKTSSTGSGSAPWSIVFTHTITWASANAARFFFNAGGIIKWQVGKSSTGTVADPEWNDLAGTLCGAIFITGGTQTQTIAGTSYTGTTKIGGTGTPNTLLTTTGWYDLLTTDTLIYRQFADTSPYTGQSISIQARTAGSGTQLVLDTTWSDPGGSAAGSTDAISGGTAPSGVTLGTAPATVVSYFPPTTTFLTNSWGTPTVSASVFA
jgi:hypothetical protein